MTVILVLICCCVPNFIEIGSRVRGVQPPDAHKSWMFNAPFLGNGCCHGNRIMADTSETWWDAATFHLNRSIGELWHFQYFPTWRPSAILSFKNFNIYHLTVIVVLICYCVPNFIKTGSRIRPPDAHNCWMFNATAVAMATTSWRTYRGYDGMRPPKFHRNRSIGRRVIAFPTFCNKAAVRHLELEFCHSGPLT